VEAPTVNRDCANDRDMLREVTAVQPCMFHVWNALDVAKKTRTRAHRIYTVLLVKGLGFPAEECVQRENWTSLSYENGQRLLEVNSHFK